MSEFKREKRYVVLKISDIRSAGLSEGEISRLNRVCDSVERSRAHRGKPPLNCVVVESDWPEYEPTWDAIKRRVSTLPESGNE